METREFKNPTSNKNVDVNESFLMSAAPSTFVYKYWKNSGLSEAEADKKTKAYKESFEKISKAVTKFVHAVEKKYQYLDEPELITKAVGYAKKHEMNSTETTIFVKFVLKGDITASYWPMQEMQYTDMAKFLGFSDWSVPMIATTESDKADLNKLVEMYEQSRPIYAAIRNQLAMYSDCGLEAITGKYDADKHSNTSFIHPLIAALYIGRIPFIENRTLNTNIGRIIVMRTQSLIGKTIVSDPYPAADVNFDHGLLSDIARDPHSLKYYGNETPLTNLLKRFKIQIELWKNVHNLRQGKFFSRGEFDVDDSITGFLKILNSYQWAYYDSPDMYQVQDESSILRKYLATFSIRPTYLQLSAPTLGWTGSTWSINSSMSIGKVSFISTPILNFRIPTDNYKIGLPLPQGKLKLADALTQNDIFWEKDSPSVRTKKVVIGGDIVIFCVQRKYQTIDVVDQTINFRYQNLINTIPGISQVAQTPIEVKEFDFQIDSKDTYDLKSAVCVQRPPENQALTSGCSSVIIRQGNVAAGKGRLYLHYNPQLAGIVYEGAEKLERYPPITMIRSQQDFKNFIETLGTIYIYCKCNAS